MRVNVATVVFWAFALCTLTLIHSLTSTTVQSVASPNSRVPPLDAVGSLVFGKTLVSKFSGRRFLAGVISLHDAQSHTLHKFTKQWSQVWPMLNMKVSVNFHENKLLRGYSSLAKLYIMLVEVKAFAPEFDYFIVLQDGAIPSENTTWPVSNHDNDLDLRLSMLEEADGSVLLLAQDKRTPHSGKKSITAARGDVGCYGAVIARAHLDYLIKGVAATLEAKVRPSRLNDLCSWVFWSKAGYGAHVAIPNLVQLVATSEVLNQHVSEGIRSWKMGTELLGSFIM